MRTAQTLDAVTISLHSSASNYPPGLGKGCMIVGVGMWLQIGSDWYRWDYIFSRLDKALKTAHLFTVAEFLELHEVDLYRFE